MTQYAKLAALAFRVFSVVLLFYAVTGLIFSATAMSRIPTTGIRWSFVLLPALWSLIVAGVLYIAAPFLGRFAASGLAGPASSNTD